MKKYLLIVLWLVFLAWCGVQKTQTTISSSQSSVAVSSLSSEVAASNVSSLSDKQTQDIASSYIGLTIEQAQKLAQSQNRKFRLIQIDWETQMVTADIIDWRVNATSEKWKITSVSIETVSISE